MEKLRDKLLEYIEELEYKEKVYNEQMQKVEAKDKTRWYSEARTVRSTIEDLKEMLNNE